MHLRTFKPLLADALDTLLSLQTSPARHALALSSIESVIAPLALDSNPNLINAFLTSQDSIDRNVVSGLLEWLGRTLIRLESYQGSDAEQVRENMVRCLGLIQGLLLLHRRSQRLFARKSSLEYLVAVLELSRPSIALKTPLPSPSASPQPSPVLLPDSPAFLHQSSPFASAQAERPPSPAVEQQLAIAALDTLLCALVDRPKNMRAFEELGGLTSIVKVLKDRHVAQPVRIKIIELLYYYLLPETNFGTATSTTSSNPSSTYSAYSFTSSDETLSTLSSAGFTQSTLPSMLANAANEFIPQTPTKPKPTSTHQRSLSATSQPDVEKWSRREEPSASSSSSREPSPSRTPQRPRGLRHKRSQSMLSFPTQPAPPPSSPQSFAKSVSAPSTDTESTPRPRFARSTRIPLDPIPGSPDLSRPRSHRRTQSTSSASLLPNSPMPHDRSTPRPSPRIAPPKREERESAMLPPPIPLSRSTSTRVPPTSHRRTSSSSSIQHTPLARSTSLTTPSTPRMPSSSAPSPSPSASPRRPPPSPSLSATSSTNSPGLMDSKRYVRTAGEKREMLRKIMPNVEALEQKMKGFGLG